MVRLIWRHDITKIHVLFRPSIGQEGGPQGNRIVDGQLGHQGIWSGSKERSSCVFHHQQRISRFNYAQLGLDYKDVVAAMAKTSTIPKKFEYLLGKLLSVISQSQNRIYPYAHISSYYKIKQLWLFGHISIYRNMTFIFPFLLCHLKWSSKAISKIWSFLLCFSVFDTWIISWDYKFGRINKIQG